MKFALFFIVCALGVLCASAAFTKTHCSAQHELIGHKPCGLGAYPVYTWSRGDNKCKQVVYAGCGKSENNFNTLEDCERIAKPLCSS